jgi:hypothetical protein
LAKQNVQKRHNPYYSSCRHQSVIDPIDGGGKGSSKGESLAPAESHIDPSHISPSEVPAWTVAEVGKQGVDAYLVLRREEHKLGFGALQPDRIIALDFHHSELATALGDPVPKGEIVTEVQNEQRDNGDEEYAFHARSACFRG